jgi:glutamyl-Q tRNA(Asp) synthetase
MTGSETVTRFAPSPTGHLHLGHVFSALQGWRAAREAGGRFLLRLEDIDLGRCRAEFAAAILDDLAWLGLDWDGPVRRQSEHFAEYRAALDRLRARDLIYPCFCTRREIAAEIARAGAAPQGAAEPPYPGTCRGLGAAEREALMHAGRPYAWRLDLARALDLAGPLGWVEEGGETRTVAADPTTLGDIVLARKETPASYHLAVTLDDAAQGVTLVTRGVDLFPSTHIHRVLQALFALPTPRYRHHRLLTNALGRRLAKRDGAPTIRALRAAGRSPEEVLAAAQSSGRCSPVTMSR